MVVGVAEAERDASDLGSGNPYQVVAGGMGVLDQTPDLEPSNGPTEAINGRLEALRRNSLGFRNLTHYRWR